MDYYFSKIITADFETAVEKVTDGLRKKASGF